jgi:glycerate kinase
MLLPDFFLPRPTPHHAIKDSPRQTISFYTLIDWVDISGGGAAGGLGAAAASAACQQNSCALSQCVRADISFRANNREKLVICIY